jgi:TonB family protein
VKLMPIIAVLAVALLSSHSKAQPDNQTQEPTTTRINGIEYPPLIGAARRPTVLVQPRYPELAGISGREGLVDFEFVLEPDGSVDNIKVVQEIPEHFGFAKSALQAFRHFKFAPDMVNGVPQAHASLYRVTFKVHR